MEFSLEEMNVLSERLEKERSRLNDHQHLQTITQLQEKLEDLRADLNHEEKQLLAGLVQDEIKHIHGDGEKIYRTILTKIR
jgi:predicted nuclease with TOPRIM domain